MTLPQMTTTRQRAATLAALLIVMAGVYGRGWLPGAAKEALAVASEPAAVGGADAIEPMPSSPAPTHAAQQQRADELAWARDPFGLAQSAQDPSGLQLSGILWDPQQPMAIINGQTVSVGQECDGYRVVAITEESVSLTDGTDTIQLHTAP